MSPDRAPQATDGEGAPVNKMRLAPAFRSARFSVPRFPHLQNGALYGPLRRAIVKILGTCEYGHVGGSSLERRPNMES